MKKILFAPLVLVMLLLAQPFSAFCGEPVEKELLNAYNKYAKAMHDGDIESMITSFTAQARRELFSGLVLAKEGREFARNELKPSEGEAPVLKKFENVEVSGDGSRARAFAFIKTKLLSEEDGKEVATPKTELTELVFLSERGAWKISKRSSFGFEEDMARAKAKTFNPKDAAKGGEESISGLVVRADYNAKETVVKVRVKESMFSYREVSVFLPARKNLDKSGIKIQAWNSYRFTGKKHKSDEQRFLATKVEPAANEDGQ